MNAHDGPLPARDVAPYDREADRLLTAYEGTPLSELLEAARKLGREGHGNVVSYSRKVFIPLTGMCAVIAPSRRRRAKSRPPT